MSDLGSAHGWMRQLLPSCRLMRPEFWYTWLVTFEILLFYCDDELESNCLAACYHFHTRYGPVNWSMLKYLSHLPASPMWSVLYNQASAHLLSFSLKQSTVQSQLGLYNNIYLITIYTWTFSEVVYSCIWRTAINTTMLAVWNVLSSAWLVLIRLTVCTCVCNTLTSKSMQKPKYDYICR
jgi:hypothetical protein